MRFWDSAAVVPLLVDEQYSARLRDELAADPQLLVWWATRLECVSALARKEREGGLDTQGTEAAMARLAAHAELWHEVQPAATVRATAERLCRTHPLRAADALQLAAAITVARGDPPSLVFVTLDDRLATAARREGFRVLEPVDGG